MKKSSSANKAEWSSLQLLYKLYTALAQEFSIDLSLCDELQDGDKTATRKAVAAAREWFAAADERIQVHQLRQFLQTSRLADEAGLRAALAYALHKPEHGDADRDKIDFLSVQFFSVCAPSLLEDSDLTFEFVAKTLEPVLGTQNLIPLASLQGLDDVIQKAEACHTLRDLYASGVIEKGRELKQGAAQNYFEPAALVSFTRFNFLMRRCFFRAMHRDLNAILDGLRQLEQRGVAALDCRGADLSEEEPIRPLAHYLPVMEGHVPGGIFLRPATAHVGRSAGCRGRGFDRRQCRGEGKGRRTGRITSRDGGCRFRGLGWKYTGE